MATGVQTAWSATAASNATADAGINLAEGQAPSTLNDSSRAIMAAIKKWLKDWQGALVTGGISTAYTLTTNEGLTLADGVSVTCRMSATSGATPTLNVDSTGAIAIQSVQGTAVPTGFLVSGAIYKFTYYAAAAAWIVNGVSGTEAGTAVSRPYAAGTKTLFFQTSAPTGWTKDTSLNNGTIRMISGTVGADAGSANFTDVFASRTILQANLPNVTLTAAANGAHTGATLFVTSADIGNNGAGNPGAFRVETARAVATAIDHTHSVPLGGSGTAMDFAVKYADAIRATID